jgi:cytoskeletal protein CcmA (bactofilin family)
MARSQASRTSTPLSAEGDGAIVGRNTRIRGRVEGTGGLQIAGEVAGDVRVTGTVAIETGGAVVGNITASAVTVDGTLNGDVTSEGAVLLRAGAQVEGNMAGSEVALEEGASFSGRIDADFELPDGLEG